MDKKEKRKKMRFTGRFIGIKLDLQKYKIQLEDYLLRELHEAIKAWLQVVAGSGGRVPLWSGMARASLLEVAQLVNGRIVLSPLKGKSRISEGKSLGTVQQIINNCRIIIQIETNVKHYSIQEYQKVAGRGSPTAPWHSRAAGLIAFRASIENLALLPPLLKAIKIKKI